MGAEQQCATVAGWERATFIFGSTAILRWVRILATLRTRADDTFFHECAAI